jgi:DNA-directed RNA polymerase subunit omega
VHALRNGLQRSGKRGIFKTHEKVGFKQVLERSDGVSGFAKTNIRFEEREFDRKLANRHAELGFWKKCRIIQNITHRMEILFVARITIEDCLKKVGNRFLLAKMVFQRVRQIQEGSDRLVSSPKNEDVVVALREVAAGKIEMIEKEQAET